MGNRWHIRISFPYIYSNFSRRNWVISVLVKISIRTWISIPSCIYCIFLNVLKSWFGWILLIRNHYVLLRNEFWLWIIHTNLTRYIIRIFILLTSCINVLNTSIFLVHLTQIFCIKFFTWIYLYHVIISFLILFVFINGKLSINLWLWLRVSFMIVFLFNKIVNVFGILRQIMM